MIEHAGACSINNSEKENIVFECGKGGFVYDDSKNEYVDFILGFGPVLLGHSNDVFNKYVGEYMKNGIHFPSYSVFHEKYANLICKKNESVCYFKTSSETITAAIRLATKMTKKKGIIRCGFIGWHDVEIANSISWHEPIGSPFRNEIKYLDGFRGCSENEKVINWSDLNISSLKEILQENDEIGMIIIDAYQLNLCSYEVVCEAIRLCKEKNVIVIWDETKTAGRISLRGVSDKYELDYDLLVLGKAVANGAPLSMLVGPRDILKYSKDVRITGTFSKEILSIYCALATYEIVSSMGGYSRLETIGRKIVNIFNEAIIETNTENLLWCNSVFGGGMFELCFKESIIGDLHARNRLKEIFVDNNIVILLGHPSFVCFEHDKIDCATLKGLIHNALITWKSEVCK